MKKNYFSTLFVALMLFVAMPAKAQVESMTDLFGKYKLTATIETTEAGKAHTNLWKSECEVIITKGENGAPATVKNLFGASQEQTISSIDLDKKQFYAINPNPSYGLFSQNPYIGVADMTLEDLQMYTMEYHYNPETKEITIPNFSICEFSWTSGNMAGVVLAEVSNVKMELLEAEEVVIPEIEGEWSFKPYSLGYVRNDTTFAYEFKMNLTAKDDTKKLYDATFNFEGFDEFSLEATFNGVDLIIPFDSTYLDAENNIRLGIKATKLEQTHVKKGQLSFSYESKTLMWQGDYIVVRKDSVISQEINGTVVERDTAMTLQQITYGWIEREDPNAFDWSGEYTVNVKDIECFNDTVEFPETFTMVVEKSMGAFTVTEFAGYKSDYYPSIELIPGDDGKTATLDLAGYYGFAMLASPTTVTVEGEEDYAYEILTDLNGQSTSLTLTLNEDGTISIDDFSISNLLYYSDKRSVLGMMSGVTAAKAEPFNWEGEYVLTATVETEAGVDAASFPATFDVVVKLYDDGEYRIEKFLDVDVYTLNQGYQTVAVAEDGNSATLALDAYYGMYVVGGSYPDYVIMCDKDGNSTSVSIVLGENDVLTLDDFTVYSFNWDSYATSKLATYSNVTLTKKATEDSAVDSIFSEKPVVEGIFDMMGRKLDAITAPGLYIVNGKKVLVK